MTGDDAEGVLEKAEEEWNELRESIESNGLDHPSVREELGDLLFTLVNACRFMKVPAELLLRYAAIKFVRRFKGVLQNVEASGKAVRDVSPDEIDRVWNELKSAEKPKEDRFQELQARVEQSIGYLFGRPGIAETSSVSRLVRQRAPRRIRAEQRTARVFWEIPSCLF